MSSEKTTAMDHHLASCHACEMLVKMPEDHHAKVYCPRCHAPVHFRKHDSLQRTWALVIGSMILYVPANLFPIMKTTMLGKSSTDTIMSGVIHLLHTGSWPLALIVFVASVVVPMAKMAALVFLLISVQRRSSWRPNQRTTVYRLTELLGRWSMVDIFVVTILAALVQAGQLAEVQAGPAAFFFGGVVVLTMIGAESFDPRLIWDRCGANDG